jgi:hypothetical protein
MDAGSLAIPILGEPFQVYTDGSDVGVGTVLTQNGRLVAFASRKFRSRKEKAEHAVDKELLAISFALERFHSMLAGTNLKFFTDSEIAVNWRSLDLTTAPAKRRRLLQKLMEANPLVEHVRGKDNALADILSRNPAQSVPVASAAGEVSQGVDSTLEQTQDEAGEEREALIIDENDPNWKLWSQLHEELGHAGIRKMRLALQGRRAWTGSDQQLLSFAQTCPTCQSVNQQSHNIAHPLAPAGMEKPLRCWGINIVGPFEASDDGHKYLLVAVEAATKFPEAFKLRLKESGSSYPE